MGVTSKDIARICGVSRATVDRALHDKPRIDPQTKERILKVAEEMGYRPDLLARSLAKGKSMSIGVVVFDIRNRYFAQLVNSVEVTAKKYDYFVNITIHEDDPDMEKRLILNLVDRRVDGLILCPVSKDEAFVSMLRTLPVPAITLGNKVADDIPFIGIHEYQASADATRYILSRGYQKVVFVCPSIADRPLENIYSHEQRLKGFLSVVDGNDAVIYEIIDHWDYCEAVVQLVKESDTRIALFCSGDTFALEVMKELRKEGMQPPEDYGIMGFDGIDTLEYIVPPMATVMNPIDKIGAYAVDQLMKRIAGESIKIHQLLDYKIVPGQSL